MSETHIVVQLSVIEGSDTSRDNNVEGIGDESHQELETKNPFTGPTI